MTLFVVTAFLGPLPDAAFSRRAWPWHVTVSTNFISTLAVSQLSRILAESVRSTGELSVSAGAHAAFGPAGEVPVVLAEPADAWRALHDRVVDALLRAGCDFTTPFVGEAYRAHVTDSRDGAWSGIETVSTLHLVLLDGDSALVQAAAPVELD